MNMNGYYYTLLIQLLICYSLIYSMPYNVPLQGLVGGKKTLVLLNDLETVPMYSIFFADLKSRGHVLSYERIESSELDLKSYGVYNYDNIIFFAPTVEKLGSVSFEDIIEFSNEGGNVIIAVNSEVSDPVREFVEVFGVSLHKKDTEVIDHFAYEPSLDFSLEHNYVLISNFPKSNPILGSFTKLSSSPKPVLYHGIGLTVGDENILAVPVLKGNPSSYSAIINKPLGDSIESAGDNTVLITAIQGRNNARVIVSGSIDLFSNKLFGTKNDTGNQVFSQELSKWGLGESGVLRFRDITHFRSDGVPPDVILHEKERPDLPHSLYPDPEITRNSLVYRIKDEIVYKMIVEEYHDNEWHPFSTNDMQMEFVMLDPYVRKTMVSDPQTGVFTALFTAPDSYGIFKFRVLYRRLGYSVLHAETQVSIRPFKHNEYERFIFSAYPYYSSAISATIAFFVFSIAFLFSADK